MKKVIYINYMKQYGHINYDKIHIAALKNAGYDVKLIMHSDIASKMDLSKDLYALILPNWFSKDFKNGITNRILYIATLLYIAIKLYKSKYDYYVISNTDAISFGLLPLFRDTILICHDNGKDFSYPIKLFFMKKIAKKNNFVVFNEMMKQPFLEHGITNVFTISHGCLPSFKNTKSPTVKNICEKEYTVFHPSAKSDVDFIKTLYNKDFNDLLKKNNIKLILRNNSNIDLYLSNILLINRRLSNEEYQTLFIKADLIFLAYPQSFKYQVSGVSFECISNNKNIIVLRHDSLKYCNDFYNYDIFVSNKEEFLNKIIMLKNDTKFKLCVTPESIAPNYKDLFKSIESSK